MKNYRRIFICILCIMTFTMFISGCTNKGKDNEIGNSYIDSELSLPSNLVDVFDFIRNDEKTIVLLGLNDENKLVYYLSDNEGKTFNGEELKLPIEGEMNIISAAIRADGAVVILYEKEEDSSKGLLLYNNGEYTSINTNILNSIEDIKIYDDSLLCKVVNEDKIVSIGIDDGKEINKFKLDSSTIYSYYVVGNQLICFSEKSVIKYDIETGENKGVVQKLNKESQNFISASIEDDKIYFSSEDGFSQYNINEDELSIIINNKQNCFNNNNMKYEAGIKVSKEEYLILFYNNIDMSYNLYNFKKNDGNVKNEKRTLTIYSLYEDRGIKQAISMYENKHKDIDINYEIGCMELSEEEALKTLNTELIAGNGPDIIIFDGIDSENYIEKDMLVDLGDIVLNNDDLFENVVNEYNNEGHVYSFPLCINVPIIAGREIDSTIKDINSLEEYILNDNGERQLIEAYTAEEIIALFYRSNGNNFINEDKSINEENLKGFLEKCKEIYSKVEKTNPEEKKNKDKEEKDYLLNVISENQYVKDYYLNISDKYYTCLFEDYPTFAFGIIESIDSKMVLNAIDEKDDIKYNIWNGTEGSYFIPKFEVGVSKNGNEAIAKEFINEILSDTKGEYDLLNISSNKEASINALSEITEDTLDQMDVVDNNGTTYSIDFKVLDNNKINEFINEISSLQSSAKVNNIIFDKVINEMASYVSGEKNIDDTINAIKNSLEIYLME